MNIHSVTAIQEANNTILHFAFIVTIGGFSLGNCLGYSSPALPNLQNSGDFPNLETSQLSWIGSLVTVGPCLMNYLSSPKFQCSSKSGL